MKPRRASDGPRDWLTIRHEKPEPPKSKKAAGWKSLAAFFAAQQSQPAEQFENIVDHFAKQARQSRSWLEKRGWRLVEGSPERGRDWIKTSGKTVLHSHNEANSTAEEKASFDLFAHSELAVWHAKRREWKPALHAAFLAGFATGLSHARVRQSEEKRKGGRRSPERAVAVERLEALAAKHGHGAIHYLRPAQIAKLDPWFADLGKEQFRQILTAHRKSVTNSVHHA